MSDVPQKKKRKSSLSLAAKSPGLTPVPDEAEAPEPVQSSQPAPAAKTAKASPSKATKPKPTAKAQSSGVTEKISVYFEQRIFDDIEDEFYEFKDQHPDAHPTLNGFTSQAFEAGLEHFEANEESAAAFVEDLSLPKADPDDEDRKRIQRSVYLTPGLKTRIDEEFARWRHEQRAWLRSQRLRPKVGNFTQALLKAGLTRAQDPKFAANLPDDPRRSDA